MDKFKVTVLLTVILAALIAAGCAPQENTRVEQPNTIANSSPQPAPSPSAPPVAEPQVANVPFTLPLLDAMLSDDSFANDATKEIQLTDAELQKLRDISRNAVLQLSDSSSDESRSTKSAAVEAHKKVEDVLGNDRLGALFRSQVR